MSVREGGIAGGYTSGSTVPVFDEWGESVRRGTLAHILRETLNDIVAEGAEKIRFGVDEPTGREEWFEHALDLEIGHGAEHICDWRSELPQRLQNLFALGDWATITSRQTEHRDSLQSSASGLVDEFVGALFAEIAQRARDFLGLGGREENRAAVNGADFVQTVFDGSYHAEIAAAATNAPKEIFVFQSICDQETAIGSNNVCSDYVVNGEPKFAVQVPPAAAQREPGNAHCGNDTLRCGEATRLSFPLKFPEF